MTKEAKLQAAVRILPEWIGYDEEIKALQLKLENENRQTEKEENGNRINISNSLIEYFYCTYIVHIYYYNKICILFFSFILEIFEDTENFTKHEEL